MGPIINLISVTHHSCKRREYEFMILREYTIIFRSHWRIFKKDLLRGSDFTSFLLLIVDHRSMKGVRSIKRAGQPKVHKGLACP